MLDSRRTNLVRDLFLPTLLFAALGGMTWAVRGCSGFGAVHGCIFAGVTWGAAWWYIARDTRREPSRRYTSGWIVLALTVGIGLSGARGWMQWPSFFDGHLDTNAGRNEWVPIPRAYGFLWLFLAGVPWAGLGACMLAWCGSIRETRACHWVLRIGLGIGMAALARWFVNHYPQYILPLYSSMESRYHDTIQNPNLRRLANDCTAAMVHLGFFGGFLLYEVIRRDWKNVLLISTVGLVNGCGWALCQNWKWAPHVWPDWKFNFWRCWESSGGISIGIAYGIAYFLCNRPMGAAERAEFESRPSHSGPNFQWFLVYSGLTWFLSLYLRPSLGGWGDWYFTVAFAFGALYYFLFRGSAELHRPFDRLGFLLNVEYGSLLITAAFIAGLFLPVREIGRYFFNPQRMRVEFWYLPLLQAYGAILLALGFGWYFALRESFAREEETTTPREGDPNLERFGLYAGLLLGLGKSLRDGLKGWFNIYRGNERYYDRQLWHYLGPTYLGMLIVIALFVLALPRPRRFRGNVFPFATGAIWLVLIVQNGIAQMITGPRGEGSEAAFSAYYFVLFAITAAIIEYFRQLKKRVPFEPAPID